MSIVTEAAKFAKNKHKDQLDDAGNDYFIHHVQQVHDILSIITEDHDLLAAAHLHDTLKHTNTTEEELMYEFGTNITDIVLEFTHEVTNDYNGFCFPLLCSRKGELLKFADRLSNLLRKTSCTRNQER